MHIIRLKKLELLHFAETNLTDTGCKHLQGHTNLWRLSLYGTHITNAGLTCVKDMQQLTMLDIGQTNITDDGLMILLALKKLDNLAVYNTMISNLGLTHLAKIKSLARLGLKGTQITDAGLVQLSNLKSLQLERTRVTVAGVAELRKALPDCKITH